MVENEGNLSDGYGSKRDVRQTGLCWGATSQTDSMAWCRETCKLHEGAEEEHGLSATNDAVCSALFREVLMTST